MLATCATQHWMWIIHIFSPIALHLSPFFARSFCFKFKWHRKHTCWIKKGIGGRMEFQQDIDDLSC